MGSPEIYDVAEPIVAWREWRFIADEAFDRLMSLSISGCIWGIEGVVVAECRFGACSVAPSPPADWHAIYMGEGSGYHIGKGCGIYAYKSPNMCEAGRLKRIFGKVFLAGRIYEYTDGYRAEKAKIAALCAPKWNYYLAARARRFAKIYNVPVIDDPRDPTSNGPTRIRPT